jgi:hypothetical protein
MVGIGWAYRDPLIGLSSRQYARESQESYIGNRNSTLLLKINDFFMLLNHHFIKLFVIFAP